MTDETPTPTPEIEMQESQERESKPDKEAKRYRLKLRAVEQERDELRGRVEEYERAEIESGLEVYDAADFWNIYSLDDLRDEDGSIDQDKVDRAISKLREDKPHLIAGPMRTVRSGMPTKGQPDPAPTWSEALRGKDR